jgi:general secretion pathway protein D
MCKMKRFLSVFLVATALPCASLPAQTIKQMGFQDKPIQDILLALADVAGTSIVCDETVVGNASFVFSSMDFAPALQSFLSAYRLYARFDHGVYYVSRIKAEKNPADNTISIDAEDIDPQLILRALARTAGQTILFDPLPKTTVSIHSSGIPLLKAVEITVNRFSDFTVVADKDYIYVKKIDAGANAKNAPKKSGKVFSRNEAGLYSVNTTQLRFQDALDELMGMEGKEFSMLMKGDTMIDKFVFSARTFDQMLRLLLEQANADFSIHDSVYYFFDIQRKDVLKKLKQMESVSLKNIAAQDAIALLPQDFANSSLFRIDKTSNTLYLTGSAEEIMPIRDFLLSIDVPNKDRAFYRYRTKFLKAKEIIALLPPRFTAVAPVQTPNDYVFLMSLTEEGKKDFDAFLDQVDKKEDAVPITLKYLKVEDLLKNLPPSVTKDDLQDSGLASLVFFSGSDEKRARFMRDLEAMDKPKPQLRYDILVVQYERGKELSLSASNKISASTASDDSCSLVGTLSSLFNVEFDVISKLGFTVATTFEASLTDTTSNIFADTSLTALSGQEAKFQSTTTVHYLETETNETTGVTTTTGTAHDLSYGLIFSINGWLSGDGMITMTVSATVSREAETTSDTTDTSLPPTTERVVSTQLRGEAGKPIVISGLLQREKIKTVDKIPILGSIPIIGGLFRSTTDKDNVTEISIYILPHVVPLANQSDLDRQALDDYCSSYVNAFYGSR